MQSKHLIQAFFVALLSACNAGNIKSGSSGMGVISVTPEEKTNVLVRIENDQLVSVSKVDDEGDVTFNLSRMSAGMMLSASNKLDHIVKYDIYMIDNNGKRHYTSSCPMMAGAGVFESWPHDIPKLSIENFRIITDGGQLTCQ